MARRLTKKQKEALESLAELKQKEAQIKQEVKDKQEEIMYDIFGGTDKCPKSYESEFGKLTLVQPIETEIKDVSDTYNHFKKKMHVKEILNMMKFSVTEIKKQLGSKAVDEMAKKELITYKEKSPYFRLRKK